MTHTPPSPRPTSAPALSTRRRTVLRTAAWSVPAVTVAAASPAFASSEDSPKIALNTAPPFWGEQPPLLSNSGLAGITVSITSSTGRPLSGRTATVTLPNSQWTFPNGNQTVTLSPTDAAGKAYVPFIATEGMQSNMVAAAATLTASHVGPSGTINATTPIQRKGATAVSQVSAGTQAHFDTGYSNNHYNSGGTLVHLLIGGSAGTTLRVQRSSGALSDIAQFVDAASGDPVQAQGRQTFSYMTSGGTSTGYIPASDYGTVTPSPFGSTSGNLNTTLAGPGAVLQLGKLTIHDPSLLPSSNLEVATSVRSATSRQTLEGRRTFAWVDAQGGAMWRAGVITRFSNIPSTATSIGEDVFVLNDGRLALGNGMTEPGVVVPAGAYAAVAPGDTEATVWLTDTMHGHRTRRPDGYFSRVVPSTFPGNANSPTTALGYGYFKRGNMFYLNGQEIFWGNTGSPVVAQNGTIRFVGTNV